MSNRPTPAWRRPALWFLLTTAFASGCDLGTKTWAEGALLGRVDNSITVVDPWIELSLAYNRGTAFSLIPELGTARWLFALLALLVVAILLVAAIRHRPFSRGYVIALGIAAGGAVGNGWDRVFRFTPAGDTAVVDFIRVNLTPTYSWPTFNIADAWIVIGVGWLLLASWRARDDADGEPGGGGEPEPAAA